MSDSDRDPEVKALKWQLANAIRKKQWKSDHQPLAASTFSKATSNATSDASMKASETSALQITALKPAGEGPSILAPESLPVVTASSSIPPSPVTIENAKDVNDRAILSRQCIGSLPTRKQLAEDMGISHQDGKAKRRLRKRVKEFFLKYIDMSKPFTAYEYNTEIYPVVKACTAYMNREVLAPSHKKWTKAITQHVIQTIFEDTRRNAGSKDVQAERREKKRKEEAKHQRNTVTGSVSIEPITLEQQHVIGLGIVKRVPPSRGAGGPVAAVAQGQVPTTLARKRHHRVVATPSTTSTARKRMACKVIAISGSSAFTIFVQHGTSWDTFFSILLQTLPELADLQEEDYDSMMVQYKHLSSSTWKPLCGDKDLAKVLPLEGLLVRMAPEDEFLSEGHSETEAGQHSGCEDERAEAVGLVNPQEEESISYESASPVSDAMDNLKGTIIDSTDTYAGNKFSSVDGKSTSTNDMMDASPLKHSSAGGKGTIAGKNTTVTMTADPPKRGRGRPRGAKNKTGVVAPRSTRSRIVKQSKIILETEEWQTQLVEAEEKNKQRVDLRHRKHDWW